MIALNSGQSQARSDNVGRGTLLLMDVSSAGPLCQARGAHLGKTLVACSAPGYRDPIQIPILFPPCSHPAPWSTGNLQAASYFGDLFGFLWRYLWLSQRLWKKITGWKRLVVESIFLFWMGKPELGEKGINYSMIEFCCRKKWISNLLQKALCARCNAGNAAQLII